MIEWFVHPERVASPREAAALVRALGGDRVRMTQHRTRSWVLRDPPAIQRVLRAVEPDVRTEIELEGITREATMPWLEELVTSRAQFVSIAGNGAWLRVWPERDEAFVDELALERSQAFERFKPAATLTWINGSVSAPGLEAVRCLPALFAELDQPELEIDLDLSLAVALDLVEEFPAIDLEWTAGAVIQFPGGELGTYQVNPEPGFEARWRARITKALASVR